MWSRSQREVAVLISESYSSDVVDEWREMRAKFDSNRSMPNPYKETEDRMFSSLFIHSSLIRFLGLTVAKLQKELLLEAKAMSNDNSLAAGGTQSSTVSPGTFFQKAIDLEERL